MGEILPELFMPSVSSTTIFDLAGVSRRRLTQAAMAEPIAVPSSTPAVWTRLRFCCKPIVVERQRADEIRRTGKRDHADAVVGPVLDELRDDGLHDIDAVDRLAVDLEIQRLHRAGHIQRQHDVNAAGLHFALRRGQIAVAPGRRSSAPPARSAAPDPAARAAARLAGDLPGEI